MHQPEYGTNRNYLIDFIPFTSYAKLINNSEIEDFYVRQGLSTTQISEKLGFSKSTILSVVRKIRGRNGYDAKRATRPENYRHHIAPYGYTVRDGKLVVSKPELKICKIVLELARKRISFYGIAKALQERGCKNRSGVASWQAGTVKKIIQRWKDKL